MTQQSLTQALKDIRYALEHEVPHDVIIEAPQLTCHIGVGWRFKVGAGL